MSETYPILIPKILAIVTVTEETVYLEPTKYYSGEIIAGEV